MGGIVVATAVAVRATARRIDTEDGSAVGKRPQGDGVAPGATSGHPYDGLGVPQRAGTAAGHAPGLVTYVRGQEGVGLDGVQEGPDTAQPLGHGGAARPGQTEPVADGLFQFDHAVGDVADGVGNVQTEGGRAVAGGDEALPLLEKQYLLAFLAEPGSEVGGRWGGGGGAEGRRGAARDEFGGQLRELLEKSGYPEGGVGGGTVVRQGGLPVGVNKPYEVKAPTLQIARALAT